MGVFPLLFLLYIGCASSEWDIARHLSTKTPYHSDYIPGSDPEPAQCSVVHMQIVARHGSRYPNGRVSDQFDALQAAVQNNKQFLNQTQFGWLINWVNPYTDIYSGNLVTYGELEHFQLARRLMHRFPQLLNVTYNPKKFIIQTSTVPRAARSGNAFGFGLFGARSEGDLEDSYTPFWTYSVAEHEDYTLRFNRNCPSYVEFSKSKEANVESDTWKKFWGEKTARKIREKLGTQWAITADQAHVMYMACVFDVVFHNNDSHWCEMFDEEDILEAEYGEDIDSYWVKSYGNALNYNISCVLLNEIIDIMDGKIDGNKDVAFQTSKFRFAHAETIIPLATILGLYQPGPNDTMRWDASAEEQRARVWRGSKISPFAGNFVFVLYKCDQGEYKVKVLHNEVPQLIPGCGSILCPLEKFKSIFSPYSQCDWKQMCGIKPLTCLDPQNDTNPQPIPGPDNPGSSFFWQTLTVGEFVGIILGVFFTGFMLALMPALFFFNQRQSIKYSSLVQV